MRMPAVGFGLLLFVSVAGAQQPGKQAALPEGLQHVPVDALGFVHFRAGAFLQSDLGKQLLQELRQDREASRALQKLEKELGLELADIESVTYLLLTPPNRLDQRFDMPPRRINRHDPFNPDWELKRIILSAPPISTYGECMEFRFVSIAI